jgi:hypothetical protein|tara:strand:- start:287 stop:1234 length:948 start_codon:yes stop_codon:yes gene_type:complete
MFFLNIIDIINKTFMENFNPKNLRVVFAGCARDCEPFLQKTLENIKSYSSLFKESFQVIIENGSKDKTREILKKNQTEKDHYLFEDHLNNLPVRGLRLEKARNTFIEKIKSTSKLNKCDLLIVLDFDDTGNYKINNQAILRSLNFLFSKKSIGAVFANQLGIYYDMWTLRDKKYCKNDFWAEALQNIIKKINPKENISNDILIDLKKNYIDKKTYSFDENSSPILVESAFGGFGIYKMNYVLKNKRLYEGTQIVDLLFKDNTKEKVKFQKCEHVNFNLGLIDQSLELYILPYLINGEHSDVTFPPQAALNLIIKH